MNDVVIGVDASLEVGLFVKLALSHSPAPVGATPESNGEAEVLLSRVEHLDSDSIVVTWPKRGMFLVTVGVEDKAALFIPSSRGMYRLDSHILQAEVAPKPVLRIARSGNWTKIQKRDAVRLEVAITPEEAEVIRPMEGFPSDLTPYQESIKRALAALTKKRMMDKASRVSCTTLRPDDNQAGYIYIEPFSSAIRNISAAGLGLLGNIEMEVGELIRVVFPLEEKQPGIDALVEVVRVQTNEEGARLAYYYGCKFVGLGVKEQDGITRFIFSQQAKQRWVNRR